MLKKISTHDLYTTQFRKKAVIPHRKSAYILQYAKTVQVCQSAIAIIPTGMSETHLKLKNLFSG